MMSRITMLGLLMLFVSPAQANWEQRLQETLESYNEGIQPTWQKALDACEDDEQCLEKARTARSSTTTQAPQPSVPHESKTEQHPEKSEKTPASRYDKWF